MIESAGSPIWKVLSMNEKLNPVSRYEVARKERQYHLLSNNVKLQAERIAKHYAAFARLSLTLLELIEYQKYNDPQELNDTIHYLTGKIKEGHLMDFGIELEWPTNKE